MNFPGTYSFDDLPEGFYKLRYEMQVVDRLNNTGVPLYSFIDSNESTFYETKCGKLGKGETIDSGHVGLRMEPLQVTAYSEPSLDQTLVENETKSGERTVALVEEAANSEAEGGNGSFVPGFVGFLVAMSLVAIGAIVFAKRKNLGFSAFPYLGSGKSDREDVRGAGLSRVGDSSSAPAAPRTQETAAGSLIAETGKSVAAYSNVGGDDSDGSDVEKESYTGLEFSVKKGWFRGGNPSEFVIGEIHEAESEGYEVYDDESGSEQSVVDYGPVVSNIIAEYSQKLGQNEVKAQNQNEKLGIDSSNIASARNYQYETDSTQSYYTGSSRSSDPPAASYKDIPAANLGWDRDVQHVEIHHQYSIPSQHPVVDDSYQYATINGAYNAHYDDGGFDVTHGQIQYVSNVDREHNAYPSDDSDSSSSDSDSDSDSDSSEEARNSGLTDPSSPTGTPSSVSVPPSNFGWSESRARKGLSIPRDGQRSVQHQAAIPENSTMQFSPRTVPMIEYDDKNDSGDLAGAHEVEDTKSVVSSGSDQSADPPGASYKSMHIFPPPPLPRKTTPPPPRRTMPNTPPPPRRTTPNTSPNPRRSASVPRPPTRGFPSPPPRGFPSSPPPPRGFPSPSPPRR
jgi:hypothetical protein